MPTSSFLDKLNSEQRQAATHDDRPLLIVAGAGTGKTATLVHRVTWLISQGVDPGRILLLTFTRRAAAEMLRRADSLLQQLSGEQRASHAKKVTLQDDTPLLTLDEDDADVENPPQTTSATSEIASAPRQSSLNRRIIPSGSKIWGGTFHAVATRLLRRFGKAIGLPPEFSVHDRADSEDLMNVVRTELNLGKTDKRFPKKGTCMDIYSRCLNAREKLPQVLADDFPWCKTWEDDLKKLFSAYVDRKEAMRVLDYDDLLLYWHGLLLEPETGSRIRDLFDCILVDEYQDTNPLQADILYALSPKGKGLTVVGDDAQSIYSFRAATVRNILDFPRQYPGTTVLKLEQNYRSTQPILEATNRVISLAKERYEKNLWTERGAGEMPKIVHCDDEEDQAIFIVRRILEHRETGIDLKRQAVLFRASHHSILLEAELARAEIPFVKFGGLKFVEAAHVKDLLGFLRLAENPLDAVAGTRILSLLPGIGPSKARQLMQQLHDTGGNFQLWREWRPPTAAVDTWPKFVIMMQELSQTLDDLATQINRVRKFYKPLLEMHYDHAEPRLKDLEQLELIASRYRNRRRMLTELTLDPPNSTSDLAGPPHLDDDYLILSTIHSAKGLEWDAVYVIHASDGNIPSDMATKNPVQIEEERRLFYVALTRAKNQLYVCIPMRYHFPGPMSQYGFGQRTRFLTDSTLKYFEQLATDDSNDEDDEETSFSSRRKSESLRHGMKRFWE